MKRVNTCSCTVKTMAILTTQVKFKHMPLLLGCLHQAQQEQQSQNRSRIVSVAVIMQLREMQLDLKIDRILERTNYI